MGLSLDQNGILLNCASCGRRNRLAFGSLGKETRCGNCKTLLPHPSSTIHVATLDQFEALVSQSRLPLLIDFWAEWCGPCKMVAPELEKVAATSSGKMIVAKVNTEDLPSVAALFSIASIPTMVLMRDGLETNRLSGARPARDILGFVQQNVQ